jgi:hypothetical protein
MKDLFLVYINGIGKDWQGNNLYEFLFSDTIENIDGAEWDSVPASGKPEPPNEAFIRKVGRITTGLGLKLVQRHDSFAMWDAVDGIVALAWEDIDEYEEYPESRLWFRFGEEIKSVEDKLYERDLVLSYNFEKKEKNNEV